MGPSALDCRRWAGPGDSAPSVVLLHGVVSTRYLTPVARQLAARCHVVAPAIPGFGPGPEPPRRMEEAAVARTVLVAPTVDPTARRTPALVLRWAANAPGEPPWLHALMTYELCTVGARRMLRQLRQACADRIEELLPLVACPVVLVGGSRDPIAPQAWLEHLRRRSPASSLAMMSGAAHSVVATAPVALARLVTAVAA